MSHSAVKFVLYAGLFMSCYLNLSLVMAEDLPTVVVSATRSQQASINTPTSIKIITREQIEASGAKNLTEILRGQMGIHINDLFGDGTASSVSMRGTSSASSVLFIIDGRRINNIDLKGPNLNSISTKDIEKIEVVQGSAGVLYGDQAVGGVVNIITKRPEKFALDVEVFTGSYDRNRFVARVENKTADGLSYELSADFLRTNNYRDNNKLDSTNVLGRIDYELDDGIVFAEFSRIREVQELPGSLLAAEVAVNRRQSFAGFVNDYSDTETEVTRLGTQMAVLDDWSFEAELTKTDIERDVQNSFRTFIVTSPSTVSSEQIEFTPRLIASVPMNGSEMLVTMGIDWLDTDYSSAITSIVDKQNVVSFYSQAIIPLHKKISVTVGGRHSKVENDVVATFKTGKVNDRATVFEAGINYHYSSNMKFFVRVDENFRFAKVDEFTFTSPGDELDNQSGQSKEVGAEFKVDKLQAKVFVSRLELEDEIVFDPTATQPVGSFFAGANVNLDSTVHDSLIADLQYNVAKSLDVMANFTFNDAVFTAGAQAGNTISGVPEQLFTLASSYRYSESAQAYVELIYTGDQYQSGDNANAADKLGSYTVANLNVKYSWEEWTYSMRINNLLDREYAESVNIFGSIFPLPERNFWLSAALRFR